MLGSRHLHRDQSSKGQVLLVRSVLAAWAVSMLLLIWWQAPVVRVSLGMICVQAGVVATAWFGMHRYVQSRMLALMGER